MFICFTSIVLAILLSLYIASVLLYTEHFSSGRLECNKLLANSPHTQEVACQFVWKKPVFMPKGATVPTLSALRFSDRAGVSGAVNESTNAVLADCKTNPNITQRINDTLLNDVQKTIQTDTSTQYLMELLTDFVSASYVGEMEDTFQKDLLEDEIVKAHFNKYKS